MFTNVVSALIFGIILLIYIDNAYMYTCMIQGRCYSRCSTSPGLPVLILPSRSRHLSRVTFGYVDNNNNYVQKRMKYRLQRIRYITNKEKKQVAVSTFVIRGEGGGGEGEEKKENTRRSRK